ncbi:NlpC/P60 family protein [Corynebacterium phoceense]|uniref:DIP1281 family NlpC/P60 protein n=1 Tax=Corynebacterium phoceense TaxID=1686286 RepID=UPI00211BABF8|nr:NlpC/P60 family protein [Corynebacterium phoceense]
MATTLTADTRRHSIGGRFRLRSYLAAAACTASLSTIAPMAPAVAQEKSLTIEDLTAAFKGGKGSVADLAGAIAGVQGEIARLEAEIGQRREDVNRALVDLQDARTELAQAKRGTSTARTQLDDAQSAVEKAQERLNELSRTAYRRSTASESVATAAGGDAREKMLERQSYLRSQADSQKEVVDQLEQERTEKANKESQLRKAEELAAAREQRAADAEAQTRAILSSSQSAVEEAMSERSTLVAQQEEAQAALDAARGSRARTTAGASGPSATNGTQANQATRATQGDQGAKETVESSNDSASQSSSEASTTASDSDTNTVTTSAAGEGTQTTVTAPMQDSSLTGAADASDTTTQTVEALTEMSSQNAAQGGATEQGSSVDGQTVAAAVGVFGAATAMIAASQPDHTAFTQGSSFDEGQLSAIQNTLTAVSDAFNDENKAGETGAVTNAASGADSDLVGDLDGVLESLDTTQSVTDKASAAVASQGTNARIEAVIARAMSQVGTPYAWGGGDANGPTKGIRDGGVADSFGDYNKVGFDCSGLTLYAFSAAGISLPHYTGYQYNQGTKVDPSEMKRGDLIFYGPGGGQHVAIYLGDGTMVEAPESGSTVRVSPVRYGGMAPYAVRLIG